MPKTPRSVEPEQLEMFHPPRRTPAWPTLPGEIRKRVVELVARMMQEHRANANRIAQRGEVTDE